MLDARTHLSRALLFDAVMTSVTGAVLTFGAGFLTGFLGLPADLLTGVGGSFLVFAALIGYVITRRQLTPASVGLIAGYNTFWTLASLLFLVLGGPQPTLLGYAFILSQAAVVAMFALWQFRSLQQYLATP